MRQQKKQEELRAKAEVPEGKTRFRSLLSLWPQVFGALLHMRDMELHTAGSPS